MSRTSFESLVRRSPCLWASAGCPETFRQWHMSAVLLLHHQVWHMHASTLCFTPVYFAVDSDRTGSALNPRITNTFGDNFRICIYVERMVVRIQKIRASTSMSWKNDNESFWFFQIDDYHSAIIWLLILQKKNWYTSQNQQSLWTLSVPQKLPSQYQIHVILEILGSTKMGPSWQ